MNSATRLLIILEKVIVMSFALESKLNNIEKELKEVKRKIYLTDSKKKFLRAAGSWSKIDTEKLKKNIYESRGLRTREKVEF